MQASGAAYLWNLNAARGMPGLGTSRRRFNESPASVDRGRLSWGMRCLGQSENTAACGKEYKDGRIRIGSRRVAAGFVSEEVQRPACWLAPFGFRLIWTRGWSSTQRRMI